jgi:hypothetical protein
VLKPVFSDNLNPWLITSLHFPLLHYLSFDVHFCQCLVSVDHFAVISSSVAPDKLSARDISDFEQYSSDFLYSLHVEPMRVRKLGIFLLVKDRHARRKRHINYDWLGHHMDRILIFF